MPCLQLPPNHGSMQNFWQQGNPEPYAKQLAKQFDLNAAKAHANISSTQPGIRMNALQGARMNGLQSAVAAASSSLNPVFTTVKKELRSVLQYLPGQNHRQFLKDWVTIPFFRESTRFRIPS